MIWKADSADSSKWAVKAEAAQRAHEAECTQGAAETYDAERQNNWTNFTMWGSQKWCRQDPQKHKPLCRIRRGVMCLKRLSDSAGSGEWAAEAEAAHRGHGAESTTGATETWDAESQGEWADPTAWAEPEMLEEGSPETQIPAAWADHQEGAATAAEWSETQVRALSCQFNHSTCHCDIVYSWQSCSQRPQECSRIRSLHFGPAQSTHAPSLQLICLF